MIHKGHWSVLIIGSICSRVWERGKERRGERERARERDTLDIETDRELHLAHKIQWQTLGSYQR